MRSIRFVKPFIAAAMVAVLTACATPPGGMPGVTSSLGAEEVRSGVISRIDRVELQGDHQLGLGGILGAAVGGLVGNQFGGGSGRDVATVLGAIGGGVLGNQTQNRYVDARPGQHIFVRLRNGVTVAITQPADEGLRVGDAVYVDGSGQQARVQRR